MCRGCLNIKEIADTFHIDHKAARQKLAFGIEQLDEYLKDGLATFENDVLQVTSKGWLAVRCIAMLFDPLLESNKARYSRTV